MTRLQNDTMVRLLDGNPNIFRQVLEELAADEDLAGVQAALHRIMNQHFCNVKVRRVLAKGVFGRALDGLDEYNLLTTIVINGLSIEQARLLSVPGVILKFAEESAWDFLEQKFPSGPLLTKWQRGLIDAVATREATNSTTGITPGIRGGT